MSFFRRKLLIKFIIIKESKDINILYLSLLFIYLYTSKTYLALLIVKLIFLL